MVLCRYSAEDDNVVQVFVVLGQPKHEYNHHPLKSISCVEEAKGELVQLKEVRKRSNDGGLRNVDLPLEYLVITFGDVNLPEGSTSCHSGYEIKYVCLVLGMNQTLWPS